MLLLSAPEKVFISDIQSEGLAWLKHWHLSSSLNMLTLLSRVSESSPQLRMSFLVQPSSALKETRERKSRSLPKPGATKRDVKTDSLASAANVSLQESRAKLLVIL